MGGLFVIWASGFALALAVGRLVGRIGMLVLFAAFALLYLVRTRWYPASDYYGAEANNYELILFWIPMVVTTVIGAVVGWFWRQYVLMSVTS